MGVLIPRMREGWGGWIGVRFFWGGCGLDDGFIWLMSNMGEAKVFFLFDFLEKDCWGRFLYLRFLLLVVGIREAEIYDDDIRRRGGRLVPCEATGEHRASDILPTPPSCSFELGAHALSLPTRYYTQRLRPRERKLHLGAQSWASRIKGSSRWVISSHSVFWFFAI